VMGGAYQPCGHARVLSNLADFGMTPQQAIDAPRCFSDTDGFMIERGYAPDVAADLAARGHPVVEADIPLGGAQAILIHDGGTLEGGSDPRKDGCALGY
jgi:gamma-glutamyltranspeptidase / glutathione hydrolase